MGSLNKYIAPRLPSPPKERKTTLQRANLTTNETEASHYGMNGKHPTMDQTQHARLGLNHMNLGLVKPAEVAIKCQAEQCFSHATSARPPFSRLPPKALSKRPLIQRTDEPPQPAHAPELHLGCEHGPSGDKPNGSTCRYPLQCSDPAPTA